MDTVLQSPLEKHYPTMWLLDAYLKVHFTIEDVVDDCIPLLRGLNVKEVNPKIGGAFGCSLCLKIISAAEFAHRGLINASIPPLPNAI